MYRKILIRFDDICPTMDFVQFGRAVELMDRYGVKPLIGVIPNCKDKDLAIESEHQDFWNFVKGLAEKGYTIAMHGYEHQFCSQHHGLVNRRIGSEFAGLPYEQQFEKISKGKEILLRHGIATDIFFAPAHSYDANTLKALSANGFNFMSDGKSSKAYNLHGIKCLPCRSGGVPQIEGSGYYTCVFHTHEWVRPEKAYAYDQLKDMLEKYGCDVVSFEEYKDQPEGNAFIQRIDEQMFVIWQCRIKPILSRVYHLFR